MSNKKRNRNALKPICVEQNYSSETKTENDMGKKKNNKTKYYKKSKTTQKEKRKVLTSVFKTALLLLNIFGYFIIEAFKLTNTYYDIVHFLYQLMQTIGL